MIDLVPLKYTTRNHDAGNNTFLLSNAGQKVLVDSVKLRMNFLFLSSQSKVVQINDKFSLKSVGFMWADEAMLIGDTMFIEYTTVLNGGTMSISMTSVITNIQGDVLTFADAIANPIQVGQVSPMSAGSEQFSPIKLNNQTRSLPEQIELFHNLVPNSGNANKNSLIDGEQNRFIADNVDAMSVGDTIDLVQLGNKSGGSYVSHTIERLANDGVYKIFVVEFSYFAPFKIENSDFAKPYYLDASDSLKPCYFVKAFPEENNPNAALTINGNAFNNGNVGFYDESYNGGQDDFTITNVTIKDSTGSAIPDIDHNQLCTVEVEVEGLTPLKDFVEVEFHIIPPEDDFKNNQFKNAENLFLVNFTADTSGVIDSESFGKNGGVVISSNEIITSIVGNTLSLSFDLTPNFEFTSYIESLIEDERLYRISVNVENAGGTDNDNNSVSKIVRESTLKKAPIPDTEFDGVVESGFLNHAQDLGDTLEPHYNGCTEDDFLYVAKLELERGVQYDGLNMSVEVERISDGATFDLQNESLSFNGIVPVNGIYQFDESIDFVTQFLDAPNRNKLLFKNDGVETLNTYQVDLIYSVLINWRHWENQFNAFNDFFNVALPQDGQSKEWVRYLQVSGFRINVKAVLVKDNLGYFLKNQVSFDDYDESNEVITNFEYFLENGTQVNNLFSNQNMLIRAVHERNTPFNLPTTWGWIATRGTEKDPRKQISTVHDYTNQNNPLLPKVGETKATIQLISPTVAHVEARVNTNLITDLKTTFVARIQDPVVQEPKCEHPIDSLFRQLAINWNGVDPIENELYLALSQDPKPYDFSNMCCPQRCDIYALDQYEDANGKYIGFGFGDYDNISEVFKIGGTKEVCCANDAVGVIYSGSLHCNTQSTFEYHFAQLLSVLDYSSDPSYFSGTNFAILNDYKNTQSLVVLKDNLTAFTSDMALRFEIVKFFMENSFIAKCYMSGDKDINVGVAPIAYNFDVTADWVGNGVTDATSFETFLSTGDNSLTSIVITDFELVSGRLRCGLDAVGTEIKMNNLDVSVFNKVGNISGLTKINLMHNQIVDFNPTIALPSGLETLDLRFNQIVDFNPTIALPSGLINLYLSVNQIIDFNPTIALPSSLVHLILGGNQIVDFNPTIALPSGLETLSIVENNIVVFDPTIALPSSLKYLSLHDNPIVDFKPTLILPITLIYLSLQDSSMTTQGYTDSIPFWNAQPSFTNPCDVYFNGNPDSISGHPLEAIIISKNCTVIP